MCTGQSFQSTRPSRGETIFKALSHQGRRISIHSPLAGRDLGNRLAQVVAFLFQSTRPSRGETKRFPCSSSINHKFQSTRPSRGETRARLIQIRIPKEFQSTRPSRGETEYYGCVKDSPNISIHSPLAGRDIFSASVAMTYGNFNPLAPRGARRLSGVR